MKPAGEQPRNAYDAAAPRDQSIATRPALTARTRPVWPGRCSGSSPHGAPPLQPSQARLPAGFTPAPPRLCPAPLRPGLPRDPPGNKCGPRPPRARYVTGGAATASAAAAHPRRAGPGSALRAGRARGCWLR